MRSAVALAALSIVLTAPAIAAAQESRSPDQPPVYRTSTNLVALNVTVTDANSQFVRGLSAADFSVFEDGRRQALQFFEAVDMPKDLIILIDTSSSMHDKMVVAHEGAIGFLRTLRERDRGAVVTFADTVDVVQGLTGNRDALEEAVRRTAARGATALYNALYISLRQFGQGIEVNGTIRRQAIVVLTDGDDTSSLIGFDDVLSVARKSGVSVYPIAIQGRPLLASDGGSGPRRSYSGTNFSLGQLARETGAQAFFPEDASELKGIYSVIAQELSSQYSLAYASANTQADGRFRQIAVRVTERPELRLRTRTGYTAGGRVRTTASSLLGQER